jgi:transposase
VAATRKYPVELRERAVRLYRESDPKPVIAQLAPQLNAHPEALRNWIRQDQADRGDRHDRPTTEMLDENRRLRAEMKELRRVGDSEGGERVFRLGDRPDPEAVMSFVDTQNFSAGLVLRVLGIAASTYYGYRREVLGGAVVDGAVQCLGPEVRELSGVVGVEADRQYRDAHEGVSRLW